MTKMRTEEMLNVKSMIVDFIDECYRKYELKLVRAMALEPKIDAVYVYECIGDNLRAKDVSLRRLTRMALIKKINYHLRRMADPEIRSTYKLSSSIGIVDGREKRLYEPYRQTHE